MSSAKKARLPAAIARFVEQQKTMPVDRLHAEPPPSRFPYAENADVLNAIREHRRLKGYLDAGAPPGYLLIKQHSNPVNFMVRCRELGFTVEAM